MPKIKLHTVSNIQDVNFFNICYEYIDIITHDNIEDTLVGDYKNYPVCNLNTIQKNLEKIQQYLAIDKNNKLILMYFLEGNASIIPRLKKADIFKYIESNQLIIISSGEFENGCFLNLDFFLGLVGKNPYNQFVSLNNFDRIYGKTVKPYKFLFLNNRKREHRTKLIQLLENLNLLDTTLWSNLSENKTLPLVYNDYFNNRNKEASIHQTVHDASWPDGLLVPELYIDTYFSVVTETNFSIPHDYRTEKIYKPILMGHPFVAVSSYGFYRGLHNLGFKTFSTLINENFDNVLNDDDRLHKITQTINALCNDNLPEFLKEAKSICEYNREHLLELVGKDSLRKYNLLTDFFDNLNNA
jgi:hypothetical protein